MFATRFYISIFCLGALLFFSCKKENNNYSIDDGVSILIEDLAGDTGASMNNGVDGKEQRPFDIFLFRLRDQKQIWIRNAEDSAQWLKSNDWDLAFTGPYNSEVYVNNGYLKQNPGYGGTAESAVVMIDKPYPQVNEAPDDAAFANSGISKIGSASSGEYEGWFNYNGSTHIMQPVKSRTYVIQLPDKKYAKLELLNAYKGNPPAVTDQNWPAPYFTFRYFVQQDGSKNLRTP